MATNAVRSLSYHALASSLGETLSPGTLAGTQPKGYCILLNKAVPLPTRMIQALPSSCTGLVNAPTSDLLQKVRVLQKELNPIMELFSVTVQDPIKDLHDFLPLLHPQSQSSTCKLSVLAQVSCRKAGKHGACVSHHKLEERAGCNQDNALRPEVESFRHRNHRNMLARATQKQVHKRVAQLNSSWWICSFIYCSFIRLRSSLYLVVRYANGNSRGSLCLILFIYC